MQGIRSAATMLVCVALLASACGDDGDDGGADASSPIDDLLGDGAVQDFAIHLGMWVFDRDGALVDVHQPLLDRAASGAGDLQTLAGGFTFAPVEGIDGWVLDPAGEELSSLAVDFGLVSPPADAVGTLIDALGPGADDPSALTGLDGAMFVEIVSADYSAARVHMGIGDRTEIDLSFVDQLEPGDRVVLQYLFGQTYPGEPAQEAGLSGLELFVERWNQGRVRVASNAGVPEPILSTTVEVREGSTLLSRDQKRDLAGVVGVVASADPVPELYDDYLNEKFGETGIFESEDVLIQLDVPGSEAKLDVLLDRRGGRTQSVAIRGPFLAPVVFLGAHPLDGAARAVQTIRLLVACAAVKTELMAANETGRPPSSPFAGFPTTRFLPEPLEPDGEESASDDSDDAEETPADDSDSPPETCGPPTVPDGDAARELLRELNRECPDGGTPLPETETDTEAEETETEESDEEDDADGSALEIPPLCEDPTGGTHGDVRFLTFDGAVYAQQAVGEFLVFQRDNTVIQMRAEPAGDSQMASIATAFAIGTEDGSLALHRGGRTFVNGELRDLQRGERIPLGDAEVLRGGLDGWTIAWPDGQAVTVFDRGEVNGMTLTVTLPRGATGVVGQLGDGDGDPDNDYRTRDGRQLDASIASVIGDSTVFYGTYVDSWRINQDESLLHYGEGETTETFLIDGFPSGSVTVDDFDSTTRAEAEEVCAAAAVVDDRFFDGCVVDVALTGDPGYAYDAFRVQVVASPPADSSGAAESTPPPSGPPATPGDTVLTVGDERLVFGIDPPNQRPQGIQASWNCEIIDGNLFADGSIDLADGPRYSITVQYIATAPRLTLLLETPDEAGQTTNYAWIVSEAPHFAGAIESMTLEGQRFAASGELYVNETLQRGLAPVSPLPAGAALVPFSLDLDCAP